MGHPIQCQSYDPIGGECDHAAHRDSVNHRVDMQVLNYTVSQQPRHEHRYENLSGCPQDRMEFRCENADYSSTEQRRPEAPVVTEKVQVPYP